MVEDRQLFEIARVESDPAPRGQPSTGSPVRFRDLLYGEIELPSILRSFIRLPEFVRLRGVRQSNVDSFEFKDLSAPARWEHGIAAAYLASLCARQRRLNPKASLELMLAALLHDAATPPFAHTVEGILEDFNHEHETANLLSGEFSKYNQPDSPVFAGEVAQFRTECSRLHRRSGLKIDPLAVAEMVIGVGELGYLVSGTLDLDNADNVVRSARYSGIEVDSAIPLQLATWLGMLEGPCIDLRADTNPAVQAWRQYRYHLYRALYESSPEEASRQALLNYLIRKALWQGLDRQRLILNTDDGLLADIENFPDSETTSAMLPLVELVRRYRLLYHPALIAEVSLEDAEAVRALSHPQAGDFLSRVFSTGRSQNFFLLIQRRYDTSIVEGVSLERPAGRAFVFAYDEYARRLDRVPDVIASHFPQFPGSYLLDRREYGMALRRQLTEWASARPWLRDSTGYRSSIEIQGSLGAVRDWSFRLTKNEPFHAYPSTFVRTLPSTLLAALHVTNGRVIDPFGGVGTTAFEASLRGCEATTADASQVACLIARAKLTFVSESLLANLFVTIESAISHATDNPDIPEFDRRDDWFHPTTLLELARIRQAIAVTADELPETRDLLKAAFSAILPDCTARRGKTHGFFADNTPLPRGQAKPPYIDATKLYFRRLRICINWLLRRYLEFERRGVSPEEGLARVTVLQADIREVGPDGLGIAPESVDAIVTSPPYLGVTDYTLGHRLTYEWLFPGSLLHDFRCEIGARRGRFTATKTIEVYEQGLTAFARLASCVLRRRGFVAVVFGKSTGRNFAETDTEIMLTEAMGGEGMEPIWATTRRLQWHRNHGVHRLTEEAILVFRRS